MTATFSSSRFAERLRTEIDGEVRFDDLTRGLYSTDASIYQIRPLGVVIPRTMASAIATIQACAQEQVPVMARGGGTSQCGQTVNEAIVVDCSKYLAALENVDLATMTATVQPGIVLDRLNRMLKKDGVFFPIDPSTASRATIGGMTANNSSGARSIRYGNMVHNVRRIEGVLQTGEPLETAQERLAGTMRAIAERESDEIAARYPKVLRRVGGYNLDLITPSTTNLAPILVGSEGTLAFFSRIHLALSRLPPHAALGIAHFPTFYAAMDAAQHLVKLDPVAVELIDGTMIELSREIAAFRPTMEKFVRGTPEAILLVEFSGDERAPLVRKLDELDELMASLGFPESVVKLPGTADQNEMWTVRRAGLDIMSSVKGDRKPVSIIEDCAVPLEHLAEYTSRLNEIFARYGTVGTFYAHASVGCLHVRPLLNMKSDVEVKKLRAIAEEAFAYVREFKGSHSGEHGDGIVRSEFHEEMFGPRLVRAFEEVKDAFDPSGLLNPGKIVRAPKMDDRSLMRFGPAYATNGPQTVLDWSEWGGLAGAVEMCNSNGACRKDASVMCPSFMATADEKDVTRGRATALRLALSGQLGPDAFTSDALYETLDLCVGCKACKRECPTGVDMARMKTEFLYHYKKKHGFRLKDRLVADLPRRAPLASRLAPLMNAAGRVPFARQLMGFSARRGIPQWSTTPFTERSTTGDVVLFVDTFDRWFEPEIVRAAIRVLARAGHRTILPAPPDRPLCCGRTYLTSGMVDEARREAERTVAALEEHVARGVPIVGLEPSCLLTLRDEFLALLGDRAKPLAAAALLFEEFLAREARAGRLELPLHPVPYRRALVHGHCHQKAMGAYASVPEVLARIPDLVVETIDSSCCGMAGAFGYEDAHVDVSIKMAERTLLPAVRAAGDDTVIVADGTSCRHQVHDLAARRPMHVAELLDLSSRGAAEGQR
jgi:FAD/FMN-containing dehydrogenase/Fe-S oxidoreductase